MMFISYKPYFFLWLFFIAQIGYSNHTSPKLLKTDICILGGSEAVFTAAIQASRLGKEVVLIEPTGHPGGMLVEGLGKDIRFGNACVIGGIAREFYIAVENHYGLEANFGDPNWYSKYEPSVAEKTIENLLARENNITIIRKTRIKENTGVEKKGTNITKVILENGKTIQAKMYIDASIEGHMLHFADVTTETIREGTQKYGETLNGVQVVNRHNGKTDVGSWHDLSANLYGENWEYPAGSYAVQDSIVQYHRDFTIGLIWFFQHGKGVDSITRANWKGWGVAKR
jgi:ribulose 1,5-bisphosphate synthetase/thiazole synthase